MAEIRIPVSNNEGKFALVSYSHCDSNIVCEELLCLQDNNIHFWYDYNNHAGESWYTNFTKNFDYRNCVAVILFISKKYLQSKNVLRELKYISENIRSNEKIILPILIDDCDRIDSSLELNAIAKDAIADIMLSTELSTEDIFKKSEIVRQNLGYIEVILKSGDIILGRLCRNKDCPNKIVTNQNCQNSDTQGCKFRQAFINSLKNAGAADSNAETTFSNNNSESLFVFDTYHSSDKKIKEFYWIFLEETNGRKIFIASTPLEYALSKHIGEKFNYIKRVLNGNKTQNNWEIVDNSLKMFTKEEYNNYEKLIREKKKNFEKIVKEEEKEKYSKYWWLKDGNKYAFTLSDGSIATYKIYDDLEFGILPLVELRKVGEN